MENTFGIFLRQKRQEKNLTQKQLSNLLFVSESAVSKWEKDVARPDISLLPKLSEILGVSEHELITASVDVQANEIRAQAKRWRTLSFTWSLFFYISYGIAILTCFICNLAVNKTLSWFWIVLSSLILAFTFTNLPKLIKSYKLILIPLSMYLALCQLFGVCCIYTGGDWFFVASTSVLLGLIIIFTPIYVSRYDIFSHVRKYNDFLSVGVDFLFLNVLLIVINVYTAGSGYSSEVWYLTLALPISMAVYVALSVIMSVRFLKLNRFFKTGLILLLTNSFVYIPPMLIKVDNPWLQAEINDANIFGADFSCWDSSVCLENNIHLIVFLSMLFFAAVFLLVGIIRHKTASK